jgi:hypothetical protein
MIRITTAGQTFTFNDYTLLEAFEEVAKHCDESEIIYLAAN